MHKQMTFKTFDIFKNGTKSPKMTNFYLWEDLFTIRYSLWEEKPKTCSKRLHLTSGHFMKVFYETTTCTRQPLLSGPKSGRLIQV